MINFALIRTSLELSEVGIGTLIYAIGIGFSVSTGFFIVGKIYNYNFVIII